MKRHRRLLALCLLSLLLHLLAIAWIAQRGAPDRPLPALALSVRLRAAPVLPAPAPVPAARSERSTRAEPAIAQAPATAMPAQATSAIDPAGATEPEPIDKMAGPYRVRVPPSTLLTYSVSRAAAGQAALPAGGASIAWTTDGQSYTLQVDGVIGQLSSAGITDKSGIVPRDTRQTQPDGKSVSAHFDPETRRIMFSVPSETLRIVSGNQDRASVLIQLAGIGLAQPEQFKGGIEIPVVGIDGAATASYQVVGQENLASALGTLATWHLVQLTGAGEPRLELWLAPDYHWYPVQLRSTAPDGTVSTQSITRIESVEVATP